MPTHNQSWCRLGSAGFILLALLLTARPRLAQADVTDDQVLQTIKNQINFLLSQKEQNNWEPHKHYGGEKWPFTGGRTAQVLYALLDAGRSIDDQPTPNLPN